MQRANDKNFEIWFSEADMPEQVNGKWVDLETGHEFNPDVDYAAIHSPSPRTALRGRSLEARKVAKLFGGIALEGTRKQKEWAEEIRSAKLKEMSESQAALVCEPGSLLRNAKFWIENRTRSGADIGRFIEQQKAALAAAKQLHAEGKREEYAQAAAAYNALTATWGF